jgi:hypothetical protein
MRRLGSARLGPLRAALVASVVAVGAVLVSAGPAGAQQIVDAAGENGGGGLAFVILVIVCCVIVGSLFFMDKVRRRGQEDE